MYLAEPTILARKSNILSQYCTSLRLTVVASAGAESSMNPELFVHNTSEQQCVSTALQPARTCSATPATWLPAITQRSSDRSPVAPPEQKRWHCTGHAKGDDSLLPPRDSSESPSHPNTEQLASNTRAVLVHANTELPSFSTHSEDNHSESNATKAEAPTWHHQKPPRIRSSAVLREIQNTSHVWTHSPGAASRSPHYGLLFCCFRMIDSAVSITTVLF